MKDRNVEKQLVLASNSPRRKELLQGLGLDFITHPSDFEEKDTYGTSEERCYAPRWTEGEPQAYATYDEDSPEGSASRARFSEVPHLTPEELVIHNALGKAQKVASHYKNALIIGVDTVVAFQEHIINKPKDRDDAIRILRLLSNTTHKVISGVCVMESDKRKAITGMETTLVTMDRLEEADINAYMDSQEGKDKAAGYAIQGIGSLFVKKIEGDYFNVVGLPIFLLKQLLKKAGIKDLIRLCVKKR